MAIIDSARPSILESKKRSEKEYAEKLTMLYTVVNLLSLAQSIAMTVFAKMIIGIIFGADFLPASRVLQVAVWYTAFGYYGTVRNVWILAEEKQQYLWKINLAGATLNVVLNFILIPILGGVGAAIASLATQLFTNVVLCFVIKPIRPCLRYMIESVKPTSVKKMISLAKR